MSYCTAQCFAEAAGKILPCRLPYLESIGKRDLKKYIGIVTLTICFPALQELHVCKTAEEYRNASNLVEQLLFYGRWSSNNCTCPRQCNQDIYIPYTETMQMDKVYENLGKLRVFYQVKTREEIHKFIAISGTYPVFF